MSKRKRTMIVPPVPPVGSPDHYKYFLETHIAKKKPAELGVAHVRKWENTNPGIVQDQIVNEIAQKFNHHNTLGISGVRYGPSGGEHNYYTTSQGHPQLNIAPLPGVNKTVGASVSRVGHELVHANDHQIDQLNPKVWDHLGVLANTGNGGAPMTDIGQFQASLARIQDKIDPVKDFSGGYNNTYAQNQLENDMRDATGNLSYTIPMRPNTSNPDWPQLFNDIRGVTAPSVYSTKLPNPKYKLPHASEFPAFLTERLYVPLDTSDRKGVAGVLPGPNSLSLPEARFVHSTLGDMDTAYPAADYPTMNNYIRQRRGSLEAAYPGLNPQPYSSSQSSSSGSNPIHAGIGGQSSSSQLSSPFSTVSSQASSVPSPHTPPSSPSTPVYHSPLSSPNLPPTYKKGGAARSLAEHIYPFKLRHPKFSVTKGLSRYF